MKLNQKILKAINEGVRKSLLSFDDVEFNQISSNDINQKVSNNVEEWNFIQENFVDLDLPSGTLWGKHNLGATCGRTQTSWYGKYYSWGELKSKKLFSPDRYLYKKDVEVLPLTNDVAFHYNDKCSIPTVELFDELIENTKHQWIHNYNGVKDLNGYLLIGKNGNSIFIPASGFRSDASTQEKTPILFNPGEECILWSANSARRKGYAYNLYGDSDSLNVDDYSDKWEGKCIRPVIKKQG